MTKIMYTLKFRKNNLKSKSSTFFWIFEKKNVLLGHEMI